MAAKKAGMRGDLPEQEWLRRRLRTALSRARHQAGLTQREVASSLDWSVSKVVRIEQGLVPVTPSDVRVLLGTLGVDDEQRINELVEVSRQDRDAKSWSDYDAVLASDFKEMIGSEGAATSIWKYEPSVVPGYFQTELYAKNLLTALGQSEDNVALLSEVRIKRQTILDYSEPSDLEMNVIVGEAALVRPVGGGNEVMREQIRRMVEVSHLPGIHVSLLRFSAGAHPAMGQAFTILQFDDPDLYDSLYLEDGEMRISSNESHEAVSLHLRMFNGLQELAEPAASFEESCMRVLSELYDD